MNIHMNDSNCLFEWFEANQGKELSPMSGSAQNRKGQGAKKTFVVLEVQVKLGIQWCRVEVTLTRYGRGVSPSLQNTLNFSTEPGVGA